MCGSHTRFQAISLTITQFMRVVWLYVQRLIPAAGHSLNDEVSPLHPTNIYLISIQCPTVYLAEVLGLEPRLRGSKPRALPLGDTPILFKVHDGTWTHNLRHHKPLLCQLSYTHSCGGLDSNQRLWAMNPTRNLSSTPRYLILDTLTLQIYSLMF